MHLQARILQACCSKILVNLELIDLYLHGAQVNHAAEEKRRLVITRTLLDVGRGLSHMHASGFAHGDLTTHNVFLKSAGPREPRGFIAKIGKLDFHNVMQIREYILHYR